MLRTMKCLSARFLAAAMLLTGALPAQANELAERGRAVLQAEYEASHGYEDFVAEVEMLRISKTGKQTQRQLTIAQLEVANGTVKTLIGFNRPNDIRGTGLLTFSQPEAEDEQWLYLPRIKRVKKIASRDRTGSFVGSTFSYEDLADTTVDEYDYEWLREAPCGALTCDVVKRTPVDSLSGYAYHEAYVDQVRQRIRRVDYYDGQHALLKRLTASDFRDYQVGERTFHSPHELRMDNLKTGRATVLRWAGYDYRRGLTEKRDFTTNTLKRLR